MKRLVILGGLLLSCACAFPQRYFSQFYSSPLLENPAYTGKFNGDYRLGGVSRTERDAFNQLSSKMSFFYDMNIPVSDVNENDKLALGIALLRETNVFSGIKNSHFLLSAAYQKTLDADGFQFLRIGFQGNFSHKRIEPPVYIMEDQLKHWAAAGFTGLTLLQNRVVDINYADLSAGISYQGSINPKNLFSAGMSIFHANSPHVVFDGGEYTEPVQLSFQAGLETTLKKNNKLYSSFVVLKSQEGFGDVYLTGIYQTKLNHNNYYLSLGCSYRNSDMRGNAIVPMVALKFSKYSLNISYDAIIDNNTTGQSRGLEVGMIFQAKRKPPKK